MNTTEDLRRIVSPSLLPAVPGDKGVVVGWSHDRLSGLAQLVIETENGVAAVLGDWRMIQELAAIFEGSMIEVIARPSSEWGCHGIVPA
jgi:hypothetical protein